MASFPLELSRKALFTILSSRLWKEITAARPPGFKISGRTANNVSSSSEDAYRAIKPVFETKYAEKFENNGVATVDAINVKAINREPEKIFMPEHPKADAEGFIYNAAVNVEEELVEMLEASRQYQNNIEVISTLRALMMRTIQMGK